MARILVVDDEASDRQRAVAGVEAAGHEAVVATGGNEALDAVAAAPADSIAAVLTDLVMPSMNGLDLVRELRRQHPRIPTILMTAHGSEDLAALALRTGAVSYIPKKGLELHLTAILQRILDAATRQTESERALQHLVQMDASFEVGFERGAVRDLITYFTNRLRRIHDADDADLNCIGTALSEALTNAIDHGSLELDSRLLEEPADRYEEERERRMQTAPYCDRRVQVHFRFTQESATCVVRDEGPGFDPANLPNPTDLPNLEKPGGRGVFLIHSFMDEVRFNDLGNELTMVKHRAAPPQSGPNTAVAV